MFCHFAQNYLKVVQPKTRPQMSRVLAFIQRAIKDGHSPLLLFFLSLSRLLSRPRLPSCMARERARRTWRRTWWGGSRCWSMRWSRRGLSASHTSHTLFHLHFLMSYRLTVLQGVVCGLGQLLIIFACLVGLWGVYKENGLLVCLPCHQVQPLFSL